MPRHNSQADSNQELHPRRDFSRFPGGAHAISQKRDKKNPMKSDITNVMSPHSLSSDDEDEGAEESDGSAIESEEGLDDEPDVGALPGTPARVKGKTRRLAGLKDDNEDGDDDVDMTDAGHAVSAAGSEDDDDYADVEDVSDGEDSVVALEDDTVLRFAEKDLIEEFEQAEQRQGPNNIFEGLGEMGIQDDDANIARRLSLHSGDSQLDDGDLNVNLNEDPFVGLLTTESLYNDMLQDAELAIWRMPHFDGQEPVSATSTQKRVRFEETRSRASSESSSDDENNEFPDLFAEADDPALKQRLALASAQEAHMLLNDRADVDSVYDFDGEDEKLAFELDEDSSSDDHESSTDSEDDGDTTEDEAPDEQIARMREMRAALGKPVFKKPSTPVASSKVVQKVTRTPVSAKSNASRSGRGPTEGTFILDPTRASLSANAAGTKIQVRPPTKPLDKDKGFWERARSVNNSRHGSPQNISSFTIASPTANDDVPTRPFTAQSTLGSMFDGKLDIIRNNDVNGIADDLYPAMMVQQQQQASFATSTTTDASDTENQDVDMRDFIEMDFSDSDGDDDPSSTAFTSTNDADMFGTFTTDNDRTSKLGNGILEHLSQCRGVVGSFRRNQHHAKHVSSLASHPAKRASTSEYNALQKGRRAMGNSPMTPARKSHASQDLSTPNSAGVRKNNFSSPLTARRPRSRGNSLGGGLNAAGLYGTLAPDLHK